MRHGLVVARARRRKRSDYVRWQRPAAMQLWQLDIVFGPMLVDTATGELRQARIVTGVDDCSRYCVLARVVERATGRAICLAFAQALERFGAPEEVLSDNGKQFTDRFGRGGEVLFDKICRRNGIAHRLTAPSSPTTTGKIERFHQTLRRELLDDARPFTSLLQAQAAVDDWVRGYNAERPHQALETGAPVTPARALPAGVGRAARAVGAVAARQPGRRPGADQRADRRARARRRRRASVLDGGPVEFDRVVPPSGNLWVARRQFWLGPQRAGLTVRFWADVDVIHLSIGRARVKSLRSHLSTADLAQLAQPGRGRGRPAAAPAGRGRSRDRGRPRGQQQRPGRPRRPSGAGGRDPRRAPRDRPHRTADADVPRPRRRASCCACAPTRSPPSKRCGSKARAPPDRHRDPEPSRSPFSAASAPPA